VSRVAALALAAVLSTAGCAAAQHSASQRLDRAFAQLNARHPDSAELLLQPVLDSAVRATPRERGAAWLLRGVIDFYGATNPDSAAAQDFRRALALAPGLRGEWLAQVDSGMGVIWRREWGHVICGSVPRESLDPTAPHDGVHPLDQKPKILSGPVLWYPEHLVRGHVTGRVLLAGIVDTAGRIERGSIKVLASPHDDLSRSAVSYLERATFQPARGDGRPVRVCVEVPVDFRMRE
jgi:TonB family protein